MRVYSKEGLSNATISLDNSLFPMESSYNSETKLPYVYKYDFDTCVNFARIDETYLTFAPVSGKTEEIRMYAETLALVNYKDGELIFW